MRNQSYFSKQSEKQEFKFPKKVSQEKTNRNTEFDYKKNLTTKKNTDLTNSNRFSALEKNILICNQPL